MKKRPLVFLFSDFGCGGPYVGQMSAAVQQVCGDCTLINLMHDAPSRRPDLAAYLLAACSRVISSGSVVVAVVDPGVGGERAALQVESGGITFVGPDNGLLSRLPRIAAVRRIDWRPRSLSASFHGRDLFAPAAARLAQGLSLPSTVIATQQMVGHDWPAGLAKIIYIDGYGNLMSGISAQEVAHDRRIRVPGHAIGYARTFCQAPAGEPFWYANSQGLIELAVNGGSAERQLSLALGDKVLLD